jgi:ATP-dependent DNA ligase
MPNLSICLSFLSVDVVFDILFYNGKSLINNPLKERLALLNIAVQNQNNHLKLIPREDLITMEEVMKALEEAILNS